MGLIPSCEDKCFRASEGPGSITNDNKRRHAQGQCGRQAWRQPYACLPYRSPKLAGPKPYSDLHVGRHHKKKEVANATPVILVF